MNKGKTIVMQAIEFILFCFGLAMLVPPVPSEMGQVYRLTPALIIGGVAFTGSLLLAHRRGAERPVVILLKLLFYIVVAWAIHHRVFDY